MIKLEYTDESTFITEEVEFSNEQYDLIKSLHDQFDYKNTTPIIVGKNKTSLIFGVNLIDRSKDRVGYEIGNSMYRVVVEKI